jgi:hypothetical protein
MKIFRLLDARYANFVTAVKNYLSKTLTDYETSYSNSSIFGQLINVVTAAIQNNQLYIEDAMVEQNKYTAQRKKSVYSLAQLSGYNPSLGKAAGAQIKLTYQPNNAQELSLIVNNHQRLTCTQNGMTYNIILPQEAIVVNLDRDNSSKYLYVVEGHFETQTFISRGGQLYSINVPFSGDADIDYLTVKVNNEVWERVDSIYDMNADGKQFIVRTSLHKGFDVIFGNEEFGRALKEGDDVEITYLVHDGELGNIDLNVETYFTFDDMLKDISGEEVDGNSIFQVTLATQDYATSGTNSEDKELVKQMIGYNTRSLVLSTPQSYKNLISKFSFCGYNRTWSEVGSLVVNSLIIRNYKQQLKDGKDYFNLDESAFTLSSAQKQSIYNFINKSNNQLAGVVYNIYDPILCKYAMHVYVKLKSGNFDRDYVSNKIRVLVGEFFSDVNNDMFIPKSDIVHLLKSNIDEIDSVNVYFLSERNESAMITSQYVDDQITYDIANGTYKHKKETVYIFEGENPNLGLDNHGNIQLENDMQFPVLMGGWNYISGSNKEELTYIDDPLTIVFE